MDNNLSPFDPKFRNPNPPSDLLDMLPKGAKTLFKYSAAIIVLQFVLGGGVLVGLFCIAWHFLAKFW